MRWCSFPICLAIFSLSLFVIIIFCPLESSQPRRLFEISELGLYNGSDPGLPILLGILGSVFDVSKGRIHYGDGGGYNHFSGRDASRAFVSGIFTGDGLTDNLYGLSGADLKIIVDWRGFYFNKYIFVGKLIGRYYSSGGNPTKYLKGVEAKAARAAQLQMKKKINEEANKACNSRWSQDDGSEVWCDVGYPRLVARPLEIALTGKMSKRCACFKEDELSQPAGLEVYQGCDFLAKTCRL